MELSAVPKHEYERLMARLGKSLDTPEIVHATMLIASILGECCYVDAVTFHSVFGREPLPVGDDDPCHEHMRAPPTLVVLPREPGTTLHQRARRDQAPQLHSSCLEVTPGDVALDGHAASVCREFPLNVKVFRGPSGAVVLVPSLFPTPPPDMGDGKLVLAGTCYIPLAELSDGVIHSLGSHGFATLDPTASAWVLERCAEQLRPRDH